jgi:CheY-like chemotaxis protein/two-component sensor histidine kinase
LLTLLNSVLDIIATGSQKENQVHLSEFRIQELIQNIVDLELPTIQLKNLDLRLHLDDNLPDRIESDQIKIHRILLNILGNAVKFTSQGFIEIGVRRVIDSKAQDCIEFYIQDSGIGISPENLDKIFKKFFRGTSSYQGLYAGHGVGLHIVKRYIQLLQGNIWVESTPGHGTRFVITIPVTVIKAEVKPGKPEVGSKIPEVGSSKEPAKALKILLVEDNAIALKTAESLLRKQGLQFHSVINGRQAVDRYRNEHFDLVLTDIGLPDISGFEITRHIRQIEQEKKMAAVPVIGLTAHSIHEAEPEGLAAGMNQVLTKPIRSDMLKMLINDFHLNSETPPDVTRINTNPLHSPEQHPVLDIQCGINILGSEATLMELLHLFIDENRTDINSIQAAWQTDDFVAVQNLAHKMKSSALYCGAIRMRYACEALEHHFQHQAEGLPEKLFYDFCEITEETITAVEDWFKNAYA